MDTQNYLMMITPADNLLPQRFPTINSICIQHPFDIAVVFGFNCPGILYYCLYHSLISLCIIITTSM